MPTLRQPNKDAVAYTNESMHLGVNLRESRLDIGDYFATELTNFDISVKGIRSKRKEPKIVATLKANPTGYVNGMASFVDSEGVAWLISTVDGKVYRWDGVEDSTPTEHDVHLPDGSTHYLLSTTNRVRFARVGNELFGVDGSSYLFKFSGNATAGFTCQAVVGTATNLPIVPGTVVFTNGTTSLDVEDTNADGVLYQDGTQVGTIGYTSGVYTFSPSFPWPSGSVTVTYNQPTQHAAETFLRAAQDGTLQYPALLHAPIKHSSLTLTDQNAHTVTSNNTDAGGSYPTGWKQLLNGSSEVVGAYDPTTAKFMVDVGAFIPGDTITADYTYGSTAVNDEATAMPFVDGINSNTELQDYVHGDIQLAHTDIVPGTIVLNVTDPDPPTFTDNGTTGIDWSFNEYLSAVNYATGAISAGGWGGGFSSYTEYDITIDYSYWASTAASETVGVADANGKLYRFQTSHTTIAKYPVTITQGSVTVTGTPQDTPSNNLFNGATAVGTADTDGTMVVSTASTFAAGSSPSIVYYTDAAVSPISITFGNLSGAIGGLTPYGGQDVCWWNNRLWIVGENSLQFSDAYSPETYTELPLSVSATGKLKLLGYSYNRMYLFNAEAGGLGEVYYVDITDTTPSNWKATSVFAGYNFPSTDCLIRAATNDSSDIFIWTIEGWRTIKTTQTDAAAGPSLPFDTNVKTWMDSLNKNALEKSWAIVFDDELLAWHPKTGSTTPNRIHAYNMKVTKSSNLDGWTLIDMPTGTETGTDALCGAVADFGAGNKLFIGSVTGAKIVQMFHSHQGHFTATATSKGICFDARFANSSPWQLFERFGPSAVGTLTVALLDDQGTSHALGTLTIESSGTVNRIRCLDAVVSYGGTFGNELPSSSDWRVVETCTEAMELCGFQLVCLPAKPRFMQTEETNTNTITQGAISAETVTQGVIS